MSEELQGMEPEAQSESAASERGSREPRGKDVRGSGKWDAGTGRYIPVGGGSRSRVPIRDDADIPRYTGMMGIDPEQSSGIQTLGALYSHMGGNAIVQSGKMQAQIIERRIQIPKIEEDELAL
ncbi:MAG TPA: hypothetical protein VF678_04740 [bacterium]